MSYNLTFFLNQPEIKRYADKEKYFNCSFGPKKQPILMEFSLIKWIAGGQHAQGSGFAHVGKKESKKTFCFIST